MPTGRSTRTRSGIAPRGVLVSIRLAAQCRCVPVNSDYKGFPIFVKQISTGIESRSD